jgi:hypothetical protein
MSERLHHQTTRLGKGRHNGPGGEVCVMELASMLSGNRFSDRPASVCPVLAAVLRAYNDFLDDTRRQSLRRYASDCVGTRIDYPLERRRAAAALAHARAGSSARRTGWRRLLPERVCPPEDSDPGPIADYVIKSIGHSHPRMLSLLDDLIGLGRIPGPDEVSMGKGPQSDNRISIYMVPSYL